MFGESKFHFDNLFFSNPKPCGDSLIYQLGEMYCGPASEIDEHSQLFYEFTYVADGRGIVYNDGIAFPVEKYDCFWSIPGDLHRIVSDAEEPLRYCYAAYSSRDSEICGIHDRLFANSSAGHSRLFSDASLRDDFTSMLTEISNDKPFVSSMLGAMLKVIAIKAFRRLTDSQTAAYNLEKNDSVCLAFRTANYIDRNILTLRSLYAELEPALHYNYQYLARNFNKMMNMTIQRYYINKKMEKAAELLSEGLSVTRAAELLNYSCIHTFSRAFKEFFGIAPCEYKVRNKVSD